MTVQEDHHKSSCLEKLCGDNTSRLFFSLREV